MLVRIPTVQLVAIAIAVAGCGRPTLRSIERSPYTVDENRVNEQDERGARTVVVVLHRDDCPADRLRLTAPAGTNADCLHALAVGSHVERVLAIYQHPPMSCGVGAGDPRSGVGGCSIGGGVGIEQIGTPCPRPAP